MVRGKKKTNLVTNRSDKVNSNMPSTIAEAISMQQFKTSAFSNISVADMLAARQDLALIDKVHLFLFFRG